MERLSSARTLLPTLLGSLLIITAIVTPSLANGTGDVEPQLNEVIRRLHASLPPSRWGWRDDWRDDLEGDLGLVGDVGVGNL
jgi:hypothetical protein